MDKLGRVLIIIPAYNEEKTIADVLLGLRRSAPAFDRIVVNDNSTDATGEIVTQMGEKQLRLPCNLGYRHALQTGMKFAREHRYNIVVWFDADGQHDPEDVPRLVQALVANDADVVIGSRYCDGLPYETSFDRRLGQLIFSHLTRLLIGRRIYDTTSGFKVLRAPAYEAIVDSTFLDFHIETLVHLSCLGFKIVECPTTIATRAFGRSMHSFTSIFRYPLQALLLAIVAVVDALLTRRTR